MTLALVLHPARPGFHKQERSLNAALEEGVGLALAIGLEVAHASIVRLARTTPATLIGSGKIAELAAVIAEKEIAVAIVNDRLTPIQQRNLEKDLQCKVIDRTALILEIFGARARTAEGKLQVELASLTYQKSRLVRSWTHLERQRGGFGFLGGPGESQIEIDRRLIAERIDKIKRQLDKTVRTRELHRKQRRDVPYPLIALVGYTNAGKSTLFNYLTHAKVVAQDQLFATLDPTIRAIALPSGLNAMLSDTVGFISNLPTELIAAFRATLEEVLEADILLHVRDISHADTGAQKADVLQVLRALFGEDAALDHVIEVHNKIDLWKQLHGHEYFPPDHAVGVSAVTGTGCDTLLQRIESSLSAQFLKSYQFCIPHSHGRAIAWLYANGQVTHHREDEAHAYYEARLSPAAAERFTRQFAIMPAKAANKKRPVKGAL